MDNAKAGSQRGKARSRLREAQRRESAALMAVESVTARRERAENKLADRRTAHRSVVADADERLGDARAELVECSGLQRAADLLDMPAATLRAAVRRSTKEKRSRRASSSGAQEPSHADAPRPTSTTTDTLSG